MPAASLDKSNRGLLLDVVVLAANLLAMPLLSDAFLDLIRRASAGAAAAMSASGTRSESGVSGRARARSA